MKKLLSFVVTFLLAFTSLVQAQDFSKSYSLTGFDRLDMGHAFRITVRPGSYKVSVSGDKDDIDELEASVTGGVLRIRYKNDSWWNRKKHHRIDVTINMPTLKGVNFSGATTSSVEGFDNLDLVKIDISGASTSKINLNAKRIDLDLSGASSVTIAGKAKELSGEISGATTFRGGDLQVANAEIDLSGASNAKVNVSDNLSAEASGASSLRYMGNPRVKSNTSGASSIRSER
ncbi:MAG: head GIN domain-containing protein [Spirosomataceae bacterium]